MEGPIFGGAYVGTEICVSKSIGLACSGKEITIFAFVFEGKFQVQGPPGGLYLEERFNGGFFCITIWEGLIFGRAYTWRGLFSEFYGITQVSSRSSNHNIFL